MSNLSWSFYKIWNDSLSQREERELKPRDVVWASELGGSMIDRYMKMQGIKPSNPPDPRSLRKFEAGNLIEWVVQMILRRAGIFMDTQEWVKYQYPGLLQVNGKLDHLAGGKPNWSKAEDELKNLNLPEFFNKATGNILKHFEEEYPDGLKNLVLEIKSCSSFMFDVYEKSNGNDNHKLQAFHYLKAKDMSEAHIVYISKDDLRMLEVGVFNTEKFEEPYKKDIEEVSKYVLAKEQPPLEEEIIFNKETKRFNTNWKITYSSYLTQLYGYQRPDQYEGKHKKAIARWNRVLTRMAKKENMTKANLEAIEEMKHYEPDIEQIVHEEEI